MKDNIFSSLYFIKDVVLSPTHVFKSFKEKNSFQETYIVFSFAIGLGFIKTFFEEGSTVNFYADDRYNRLFTLLSIPQISWAAWYVGYLLFIVFLLGLCRLIIGRIQISSLVASLLSISAVGVIFHVIFLGLKYVFPESIQLLFVYIAYLWAAGLSVVAIKTTQGSNLLQSAICYLIPALPLTFTMLPLSMFPYLAYIKI